MIKSLHFQVIIVLLFVLSATFAAAQVKTNGANLDLGNANIVNGGTGNFSTGISITGGSLNLNARSITNVQDFGMNGAGQFIIGASSGDKIVMNGGNITTCGNLSFNSSKTLDMNSGNINSVGTITSTTVNPTNLGGHTLTGNVDANSKQFSNVQNIHMTGGGQITHPGGTTGNKITLGGGDIVGVGTITANTCNCSSDGRFKKDISSLPKVLEKVKNIRGVNYYWNREAFPEKSFSTTLQIGFIAQELEKEFPELVNETSDGYKAVQYSKMTAILVEAIKEQQAIIEAQQKELDTVKSKFEKVEVLNAAYAELASRLDKLEGKTETAQTSKEVEIGEE